MLWDEFFFPEFSQCEYDYNFANSSLTNSVSNSTQILDTVPISSNIFTKPHPAVTSFRPCTENSHLNAHFVKSPFSSALHLDNHTVGIGSKDGELSENICIATRGKGKIHTNNGTQTDKLKKWIKRLFGVLNRLSKKHWKNISIFDSPQNDPHSTYEYFRGFGSNPDLSYATNKYSSEPLLTYLSHKLRDAVKRPRKRRESTVPPGCGVTMRTSKRTKGYENPFEAHAVNHFVYTGLVLKHCRRDEACRSSKTVRLHSYRATEEDIGWSGLQETLSAINIGSKDLFSIDVSIDGIPFPKFYRTYD
ncbi:hypothetical protein DdX_08882 [Ditylenchus destructor]|uniref:Uncharacterized protein n=1 Tax=Ditylenchus destructor TaxID=166010 RepID=A0AAD4N7I3_9BILA|nr:hypothetical protein DdX_08882 [Ditylenchus destructor]